MIYSNLSDKEELLGKEIVDAAYKVHKELGPGLLEKIYETCFCYELDKKGIANKRQVELPINYKKEVFFEDGLRMDVLVDELIILFPILHANCIAILSSLDFTINKEGFGG